MLKNLEMMGKHVAVNAFKGEKDSPNIIMPTTIELVAPGYNAIEADSEVS